MEVGGRQNIISHLTEKCEAEKLLLLRAQKKAPR